MKTITIELDSELERQIDALSEQEGRDTEAVVRTLLVQGLAEKNRRERLLQELSEVLASPAMPPFDRMSEEEIMQLVVEEIGALRSVA